MIQERLLNGLSVYFVAIASDSSSYISTKDLEKWNLPSEAASRVAKDNLRELAKSARVVDLLQDPWVAAIVLDGIHEGSPLALPDFWNDLQSDHGNLGVMHPARGALFVFKSGDVRARSKVTELVDENFSKDPYAVSRRMFERTGANWVDLVQ